MTEVFAGLTGTGDATLAVAGHLDHIGVSVTTIPAGAAVMEPTHPWRLMKVGWLAPARLGSETSWPATVFCEDAKWIDFEREQISYPTPGPYADRIRYHLEPGAVATLYVNQVVAPAVLNTALMPWDRAATSLALLYGNALGPHGVTTRWTYTVAAGKKIWLASCNVSITRQTIATAHVGPLARLLVNGGAVNQLLHFTNVAGAEVRDQLLGAPLVLGAGATIALDTQSGDTGGQIFVSSSALGFVFDA